MTRDASPNLPSPPASAGPGRLTGKLAVVSGAAGGVGGGICRKLLAEGARVAAWDLRELSELEGVSWFTGDLTDEGSIRANADLVFRQLGEPDILVHNAAASVFAGTLHTTAAQFHKVMSVNVLGAILLTQAFAPSMMARGSGSIVHIASITGIVGAPGLAVYSASKGALITLTRSSALELAESGVRVNCVCPASVDTPLLRAAFNLQPDPALARENNIKRHPLGRLGTPEDVANLVAFLSSDEAAWITGGTYVIDGGASIARRWQE